MHVLKVVPGRNNHKEILSRMKRLWHINELVGEALFLQNGTKRVAIRRRRRELF
jgi:hypothetical protein